MFVGNAALVFSLNELFDLVTRVQNAASVLWLAKVIGGEIVPSAYRLLAVEGHRADGGVGKDKANTTQFWGQLQFWHKGFEIVAVGSQTVQPDDTAGDRFGGVQFDAWEEYFFFCHWNGLPVDDVVDDYFSALIFSKIVSRYTVEN